jgi:hypothetical protein
MPWPQPVTDQLQQIATFQPLDRNTDEGRFNALSAALVSLEGELREQIQGATEGPVTELIHTLRADGPIAPPDLELIRLWVVGDAEYYVKMENDFPAWMIELERLMGVLQSLSREAVTPATMAKLAATVRDALRVSSDIVFYRQQEERVRSFQDTTARMTRDDKKYLADILAQKLSSDQM